MKCSNFKIRKNYIQPLSNESEQLLNNQWYNLQKAQNIRFILQTELALN